MAQSKYWCFMINNPSDTDKPFDWPGTDYVVYQLEKSESGTLHHQGYVEFPSNRRMNALKKVHATAHWEKRLGTRKKPSTTARRKTLVSTVRGSKARRRPTTKENALISKQPALQRQLKASMPLSSSTPLRTPSTTPALRRSLCTLDLGPQHVIVFANTPPDMTKWSADRYDVHEIKETSPWNPEPPTEERPKKKQMTEFQFDTQGLIDRCNEAQPIA